MLSVVGDDFFSLFPFYAIAGSVAGWLSYSVLMLAFRPPNLDTENLDEILSERFFEFFFLISLAAASSAVGVIISWPDNDAHAAISVWFVGMQLCLYAAWKWDLIAHRTSTKLFGVVVVLALSFTAAGTTDPFRCIWYFHASSVFMMFVYAVAGPVSGWAMFFCLLGASVFIPPADPPFINEHVLATQSDKLPLTIVFFALLLMTRLLSDADFLDQALRASINRSSKLKDEFMAMISHELRNPLNGILGSTELLKAEQQDLNDRQREHLRAVDHGAKSLHMLVQNILLDSTGWQTSVSMAAQEVSMRNFMSQLQSVLTALAYSKKGLQISVRLGDNVPSVLIVPEIALGQVILNLGSNAIKQQDFGKIIVSATLHARGRTKMLRVSVHDEGPAIDPHMLESLSDSSVDISNRAESLSIARHLANGMKGVVGHEVPDNGIGAVFFVEIPVKLPSSRLDLKGDELQRPGSHTGSSSSGSGAFMERTDPNKQESRSISQAQMARQISVPKGVEREDLVSIMSVVVDDDLANRLVLSSFIERLGIPGVRKPVEFENASDALHWLLDNAKPILDNPFNRLIIFLDLVLPGLSGANLADTWRYLEESMGIVHPATIAVVSGLAPAQIKGEFDVVLQKPIRVSDVTSVFTEAIKRETE